MTMSEKESTINYAVIYYIEDDTVKRAYKGMKTAVSDDRVLWMLSNFLDDLLLAHSSNTILYAMICKDDFPVDELDKLVKKFLKEKKQHLKIKKIEFSGDYV